MYPHNYEKSAVDMKREIEREVRLPAFALQVGELELLWQRMHQMFEPGSIGKESIDLSLPSERLHFDSLEELRSYKQMRGRVTNFSLRIVASSTSITLKTGGLFSNIPTLKVEGDSDIWCAGAVEAVMSVVQRNRTWYWWLVRAPLATLFFLASVGPYFYNWVTPGIVKVSVPLVIAYVSLVFTLGFLFLTRDKLLPTATLVFTNDLGFIRKYGAELGLVLGLISLAVAGATWWYPRAP